LPPVVVDNVATVHWLVICRSIKMTVQTHRWIKDINRDSE
jgi:hypothetical protein